MLYWKYFGTIHSPLNVLKVVHRPVVGLVNQLYIHLTDSSVPFGQGYLAVKGRVSKVEVWGLGGFSADEQQAVYQHRENLFSEQRRKVHH